MPSLDNERHELFAQGLFKGLTADEAYVVAGFKRNRGNASRLKADESIMKRVEELMAGAAERAEITQADVLRELAKIGFSDIRKLFTPGGNLVPIHELGDDAAACLSSIEVVTKRVPGGEEAEVEHVAKIKTWDKRAALVDIGKHLGMFKDKVELTGKDGGPIEMADMDLARLIAFQLTKASQA